MATSLDAYPMRWRWESRGGYGYTRLVPCRILSTERRDGGKVKIAALRKDGTEVVRWVEPANLSIAEATA